VSGTEALVLRRQPFVSVGTSIYSGAHVVSEANYGRIIGVSRKSRSLGGSGSANNVTHRVGSRFAHLAGVLGGVRSRAARLPF